MTQEEFSLDTYLAAVWRAKWIILAGTILAAGAAAYLTSRQPSLHRATALVKIGRVWKEPLEDPYITAKVANSAGFLQALGEKEGGKHRNKLKRSLSAETVVVGPRRARYPILLSVTATTEDAAESVRLALAGANEVIERHQRLFDDALKPHLAEEQRLDQRLKELSARPGTAAETLLKLEDELHDVRTNNSLADPNVTEKTHLVEDVVPDATISPDIRRNTGAAALIAAVLLIAAAALASHFKPAPKTEPKPEPAATAEAQS
jgi:hypothetical protein